MTVILTEKEFANRTLFYRDSWLYTGTLVDGLMKRVLELDEVRYILELTLETG